jgi:predicted outer membrane repeat protein
LRPLPWLLALGACTGERTDTVPEDCAERWGWVDADGDGYGNPEQPVCGPKGVDNADDCDDTAATVHAYAPELCGGIDEDCDGQVDEDAGPLIVYFDADGDGHGTATDPLSLEGCEIPEGYALLGDDCDDMDVFRSPSAAELCDGLDNRCDPDWKLSNEDGHVTYLDVAGQPFDLTSAFATGDPGQPDQVELPGGTLLVCPGTYFVNLTVSEPGPVSIVGRGSLHTVLDGAGGRIIEASTDLFVEDLALVGGDAHGGDGGAILQQGGSLYLSNAELRNNQAGRGGAVAHMPGPQSPGDLDLFSVSFLSNHAEEGGGGLYVEGGGLVTASVSRFESNDAAGDGGGIAVHGASSVLLEQTVFSWNIAVGMGGGMALDLIGPILYSGGSLSENAATGLGGGAFLASPSLVQVDGVVVTDNLAGDVGGGMAVFGGTTVDLLNVTLLQNTAPFDGGALYLVGETLSLTEVVAEGNVATATGVGGGVAAWISSALWLTGGGFRDNSAQSGGGLALFAASDTAVAMLDSTFISENIAMTSGGGLLLGLPSTIMTNTTWSANEATSGAALAMSQGEVTLGTGVSLTDNLASVEGGVAHILQGSLFCDGSDMAPVLLHRNSAELGGAVSLAGTGSSFDVDSCDFGTLADENLSSDAGDVYVEAIEMSYDFVGSTSVNCTSAGCF